MIRRSCDRCGERLVEQDPDRTELRVTRGKATRAKFKAIDCCQVCAESLVVWLATFPRPEQATGKVNGKAGPRGRMPIPPQFRGA